MATKFSHRLLGLMARRPFQKFWETLFKISVRGMGYNNVSPAHNGEYRALSTTFSAMDTARPVFLDVGANEGDFVARVLETKPMAEIHAFEPNPPVFSRLKDRFEEIPNVSVNACGVSSKKGEMTLSDIAGEGSVFASFCDEALLTMFNKADRDAVKKDMVRTTAPVVTLDHFCTEHKINLIDFLKIDVEGHEKFVLEGAEGLLKARRIRHIQLEMNAHNAVTGFTLHQLMRLLDDFACYKVLPDGLYAIDYAPVHENLRYSNFLFVLK